MEQMLLEGGRNGGFAGCREASEPDGGALLLAEFAAFFAAEAFMPCDVAGGGVREFMCEGLIRAETPKRCFDLRCHFAC